MRLPQDLANLLAIAIRDVVWFKKNVQSFLEETGVPKAILLEADAKRREGAATIPIIHHVLDRLADLGTEGFAVEQKMLTRMYYWNDLHSVSADRRSEAVASLKALREGHDRFRGQQEYQAEVEKIAHKDRVERTTIRPVDHARLEAFRVDFDRVHRIVDRQQRGNAFQDLMNQIFDYYSE